MEIRLGSCVTVVLGRGVAGSFATASVTNTSEQPTKASKNSRNVICKYGMKAKVYTELLYAIYVYY